MKALGTKFLSYIHTNQKTRLIEQTYSKSAWKITPFSCKLARTRNHNKNPKEKQAVSTSSFVYQQKHFRQGQNLKRTQMMQRQAIATPTPTPIFCSLVHSFGGVVWTSSRSSVKFFSFSIPSCPSEMISFVLLMAFFASSIISSTPLVSPSPPSPFVSTGIPSGIDSPLPKIFSSSPSTSSFTCVSSWVPSPFPSSVLLLAASLSWICGTSRAVSVISV
mmetsp:Transcript_14733/g.30217  ORF Transcript_14733/g.30217 Transcript_14733/m.30217 type:complete len:219 (-) Transcript_14733:273-929(-)